MLFDALRIHGTSASILWHYHTAVTLDTWAIVRVKGQWTLSGTCTRVERFMVGQPGLLFTAPREGSHRGYWAWGIESLRVGQREIIARLGPPEQ